MLLELMVDNVLIVETARLEPGAGLTVITGETGAGKSLLLDALDLLLGGRGSGDLVGPAKESLTVSAVLAVPPALASVLGAVLGEALGDDATGDTVVLRRRVSRQGRSQAWINDLPVSVRALREVSASLVEVRSQNDQLRLADPDYQLHLLDRFAALEEHAAAYAAIHRQLSAMRQELERLLNGERDSLREGEFVRFQLQEIDSLAPEPGEFARLEDRQQLLAGAQEWRDLCDEAVQVISESEQAVAPLVARLARRFAAAPDEDLRQAGEAALQAGEALAEVARLASSAADRIDPDPQELSQIEDRLGALLQLMRKHGGSEERLLAERDALRQRLAELSDGDARRAELSQRIAVAEEEHRRAGKDLAKRRRQAAKRFTQVAAAELAALGMPKATLQLQQREGVAPSAVAYEAQEFHVSTNPGLPAGPLGKVPSGGETSRLSLAMTVALASGKAGSGDGPYLDHLPVMVFDEIDAGVGGRLGAVIAQKLRQLAQGRSVIAISHTPQMAAHADVHYHVDKRQGDHRTEVVVTRLEGPQRCQEIAEMLGGGSAALKQAQVLLGDTCP